MKTVFLLPATLLSLVFFTAIPVQAHEAGDWLLRIGAHVVDPKSGNGTLAGGPLAVDVDSDVQVGGAGVGSVNIDPIVYGAYVGYRF